MTVTQLKKFIRIRNNSAFNSNLQFEFDAQAAGFSAKELGQALKTANGYEWRIPGNTEWFLIEENGKLRREYRGETMVISEFTISRKDLRNRRK